MLGKLILVGSDRGRQQVELSYHGCIQSVAACEQATFVLMDTGTLICLSNSGDEIASAHAGLDASMVTVEECAERIIMCRTHHQCAENQIQKVWRCRRSVAACRFSLEAAWT
jgi:hypothetical protein